MINLFPDKTFIFQWLIFMAAVAVLTFGIFLPALKIINERRARTIGRREKARQLDDESVALEGKLTEMLEEARREGYKQKEAILSEGMRAEEEMVKVARKEAEKILGEVRKTIREEYIIAQKELAKRAEEISDEIASKVLGREI